MYSKPEVVASRAISVIQHQNLSTKGAPAYIDVVPPQQGLLNQTVTAAAYQADE